MTETNELSPSSFIEFKVGTLKLILILATLINVGYTLFVVMGIHTEDINLAMINVTFSLETVFLYFYLRQKPHLFFGISAVLAFSAFMFFSFMVVYIPDNNFHLIWFLPLIIFSFFFINAIIGFTILILTISFIMLAVNYHPAYISEDSLYSLLLCLIAVGILAHHFSKQIHAYETTIIHHHQQLQNLVTHDQMTGVLNRQGLLEMADQYFNLANRRYISALCMVVFDIDHFKAINDNHGHLVGDKSIEFVANLVKRTLRKSDLLARMGGDEFVMVLPETNWQQAEKLLAKIQTTLKEMPLNVGSEMIYIEFSAGIAQLSEQQENFKQLFKIADEALYLAKENGRNQFVTSNKKFTDSPSNP